MFKDKKVALYVTGGIAVYKSLELLRTLVKSGAEVKVAMTEGAAQFVSPLTFQVLSKNTVHTDTFSEEKSDQVQHVHLADWADLSVVAPATANTIAKMANGIADNFVTSALLATNNPIFVVPAMNTKMYENLSTQRNIKKLRDDDIHVMEPDTGFLAEGYEGKGRFPEVKRIISELEAHLVQYSTRGHLNHLKVLVTAGGTKERIDPVRFLTNDSSGKMGHAIAREAYLQGADVTLITASSLEVTDKLEKVSVSSTDEMYEEVDKRFDEADILIMSAAVSDYKPKNQADQKMKKQDNLSIDLVKNPDILQTMGNKKTKQYLVGFAAETENIEEYAKGKLESKNADIIVANNVGKSGQGFNSDNNEVTLFTSHTDPVSFELNSKERIAEQLIQFIAEHL